VNRGTATALGTIAVGLAGTIVDPDGVAGIVLFGAAAAAVLYLIARPVARHLRLPSPARVPMLVRWRTVVLMAAGAGALLGATNLFDENGRARSEEHTSELQSRI